MKNSRFGVLESLLLDPSLQVVESIGAYKGTSWAVPIEEQRSVAVTVWPPKPPAASASPVRVGSAANQPETSAFCYGLIKGESGPGDDHAATM
jgi:hypothetical protein